MADQDPRAVDRAVAAAAVMAAEQQIYTAALAAIRAFLTVARSLILDEPLPPELAKYTAGGVTAGAWIPDDPVELLGARVAAMPIVAAGPPDPDRWPDESVWAAILRDTLIPAIGIAYGQEFKAYARQADIAAERYRERYLATVFDRLVIWPTGAFEEIRPELLEAFDQSETIAQQRDRIGRVLDIDALSRRAQADINQVEARLDADERARRQRDIDAEADRALRRQAAAAEREAAEQLRRAENAARRDQLAAEAEERRDRRRQQRAERDAQRQGQTAPTDAAATARAQQRAAERQQRDRELAELRQQQRADREQRRAERDQARAERTAARERTGDRVLSREERAELRAQRRALYDTQDREDRRWQWKAERIARTEAIGALNGGTLDSELALAEATGDTMFKQWLATSDERTRETHEIADGQVVPLDGAFTVGGAPLAHPGDPTGPPQEVINCRCTLLILEPDEAQDAAAEWARKVERLAAGQAGSDTGGVTAAATEGEAMPPSVIDETATVDEIPVEQLPTGWEGTVTIVGRLAGQGDPRILAPQPLATRPLPQPLHYKEVISPGHDQAVLSGSVDELWMDGDRVEGRGRFDLGSMDGREAARRLHFGFNRWLSLDPGDGVVEEMLMDPAGELHPMPSIDEIMAAEEAIMNGQPDPFADMKPVMYIKDWNHAGATILPHPAFEDAEIRPVYGQPAADDQGDDTDTDTAEETSEDDEGLVPVEEDAYAAVTAAGGPLTPPARWFEQSDLDGPTPLTVTRDGAVFGHIAPWGVCHTGIQGKCVTPPRSPSGYAHFHLGSVRTAEGDTIAVGALTVGGGHAPLTYGPSETLAHYDNATTTWAVVRAYEDAHGIAVFGAVVPSATDEQVAMAMRTVPSGDWRPIGGRYELFAVLNVNRPGFPVLRASGELDDEGAPLPDAGEPVGLVAAGSWAQARLQARHIVRSRAAVYGPRTRGVSPEMWEPGRLREMAVTAASEALAMVDRRAELARLGSEIGADPGDRIAELGVRVDRIPR